MKSLTFNNPNPATGEPGTLVTTTWFQNVNDEISNVITKNGGEIDSTNTTQLYTTLQTYYATLASPAFTGTPTVPTPADGDDSQKIANTAWVKSVITAGSLGYTPVRQGGVTDQGTNTVYIGKSTENSNLLCTVDTTDYGSFAFQSWCNDQFLPLTGGNVTGTLTYNGTTVATINDVNNAETDVKNWADDTFVGKAEGDQDYSPLQAGVNKTSGEIWLSYTNSSGNVEYAWAQSAGNYQPAGDYVNRAGDTMTGNLYNSGGYSINYSQAGSDANGVWYQGFTSAPASASTACSSFVHRTRTGLYDYLSLQLSNSNGSWHQLEFRPDDRLYTVSGNVFALTSELPASGTTAHGSYVTVGNIRTLYFMLENIQSGTTYEFDLPFSGTPHSIVVAPIAGYSTGSDPATGAWSASSFVFWNAGNLNGSYSFIATGPV